ncbi:MAG: glycosyltransferase family 4 protein [Anaerolineales bacterium]
MRVLYFSFDYTPHDYRFLTSLAGAGYEVFYARLVRSSRPLEDRLLPPEVEQVKWEGETERFRWRDLPAKVRAFRALWRRLRPDLVHAGPIQTCALTAALAGAWPLLTMSWGFDLMEDAERNAWWRWATRYPLRRSTFFVSDAEVTRRKAIAYGMLAERTLVFPWGVDLERFAPPSFDRFPTDHYNLLCNRSWEARYGVDVLVRAFVRLARQREDVSLLLLGSGSQAPLLHHLLREGGVWERVYLPGRISQADLPQWYARSHLFISPSHVDGSSVSLMEALACGLPVVVSDIPANREWVEEGVNGWLFPDGDDRALSEVLLRLLENPSPLAQAGQAARRVAEARADWKKNFEKLTRAYQITLQLSQERRSPWSWH